MYIFGYIVTQKNGIYKQSQQMKYKVFVKTEYSSVKISAVNDIEQNGSNY
jgi:hypothetical protein